MARQYSRRTFLRRTPKAILKEYFAKKGVLGEIDFNRLNKRTGVEVLSEAIAVLPDDRREAVEADFEQINELAYARGVEAILEEAAFRRLDWGDAFAQMSNHYERAFRAYLDDPNLFYVAGQLDEMNRTTFGERRTIYKNLEPKVEQDDKDALAAAISKLYRKQGRGRYCAVDNYLRRDPERHCYFVYPEDHPVTESSFDEDGKLQQVPRRPVFEIIFVYRPEDGVLELSANGNQDHKEELMEAFCQTILGLDELPEEDPVPDYDLSPLKTRDMVFRTEPEDGVEHVEVRMLRLDLPGGSRANRVTFESNPSPHAPKALYDLIDEAINKENVSLERAHAARAKLRLTFAAANGGQQKTLTFEIGHPNRCTLKDDKYDQIAKKYLQRWGIARK